MGSRGSFEDVNTGNFTFVEGGQKYFSLGTLSSDANVKILMQKEGAVKAPEYSHTAERVYAIIQEGKLKHVSFYNKEHKQIKSIDLLHPHGTDKLVPHVHYNMDHTDKGIPISKIEENLIKKIKREYHLK